MNKKILFFICCLALCLRNLLGHFVKDEDLPLLSVTVTKLAQDKKLASILPYLDELSIKNPQCIIWYSGEDGLTDRAYNFYETSLFKRWNSWLDYAKNIRSYHFFLYDLKAWKGLKTELFDWCSVVGGIALQDIEHRTCIHSYDFFRALNTAAPNEQAVFKQALHRPFVWTLSSTMRLNNVAFGTLSRKIPDWFLQIDRTETDDLIARLDTAQGYSALQYIEGLWLVQNIVYQSVTRGQRIINVVFLLPASGTIPEYRYYCPENEELCFFSQDVKALLSTDDVISEYGCSVNVYFVGFSYNDKCSRPYLYKTGDKILNESDIL